MTNPWTLLALAPVAVLPFALPSQDAPRKLTRVPADAPARDAAEPAQRFDSAAWKQKLSDADLARREEAYGELCERARSDRAVRAALEEWAHATDASELAWTARLALRELERAPLAGRRGASAPFGHAGDPDDDWNSVRSRFDELERRFGGMDTLFEDLRSQLQGLSPDGGAGLGVTPWTIRPLPGGARAQAQTFKLQVGPDGVSVETTEKVDGDEQVKTYKAKTMDELLEAHPELREQLGGGVRFDLRGMPGLEGSFFGELPRGGGWLQQARPSTAPPTDVLGIYSEKLTPEQARSLDLEPEQGLRVQTIQPGTIAQVLGIQRGDTIVEINGRKIYSPDDVKRALKERKPDGDVVVKLVGEGRKEARTLRWTPTEPQAPEAPGATTPKKL